MQRVYYRRQVVAARFFASLLCAAGIVVLTYAAFTVTMPASVRFGALAAAMIGYSYFGSNMVCSFIALLKPDNALFYYDETSLWNERDWKIGWEDVSDITIEGARVGILFRPIFPTFNFQLTDGSQLKINTYNAMTELEMKEWKVKLKRQQKAYHSGVLPVDELA
ncbi:hypothetical protein [Paenibacillus sp. OSY-SE]|uniref:hypothetical protein n=1 Tax=Paenibacillus sp. OSY-SE TaxID=1196323 RepID=UPI0002DC81A2|nr:hypothetical protein [Paenibacillus sp. OSY-SE]